MRGSVTPSTACLPPVRRTTKIPTCWPIGLRVIVGVRLRSEHAVQTIM
jgi:hypothetical protein